MSLIDMLLAAGILAVAGWVFYKSYIKKKGACTGCSGCASRSCGVEDNKNNDRLIHIRGK